MHWKKISLIVIIFLIFFAIFNLVPVIPTKYNFVEGIVASVAYAKTQGGHGSQSRTGEIMKELVKYGSAAKGAIPGLKELIDQFNEEVEAGKFPGGEMNNMRVTAVQEAIKAIEAATTHPKLRSIKPK